jgi:hypothetical protein
MKKIIAITAFKRPRALQSLLTSLIVNDLSDWSILIRLEPSPEKDECIRVSKKILGNCDFIIHVNQTIEGIRKNTFNVVHQAFSNDADLVLYLEEDLIVSPDTTDMCSWYYENSLSEVLCLNLLARTTGSSACFSSLEYPKELIKTKSFNSQGIAITKKKWKAFFESSWLLKPSSHLTHLGQKADGWDFAIYSILISHPNLYVIQPLLARANHVGGTGTYCTDEYQEKSFSYVEICKEKITNYRLVELRSLQSVEKAFFILMDEMNSCINTLSQTERERINNLNRNTVKIFFMKAFEKLSEIKSSERSQLAILSIKGSRVYKFLKSLLRM